MPLVVAAVAIEITEFDVLHMIGALHPSGSKKDPFVVIRKKVNVGRKMAWREIEASHTLARTL